MYCGYDNPKNVILYAVYLLTNLDIDKSRDDIFGAVRGLMYCYIMQ